MSKKKKIIIAIGIVWVVLAIIGAFLGEETETQENISQTNEIEQKSQLKKFDLRTFQQETMPYWTIADIEDNILKIVVAPVFDTSKIPSAPNIAAAIYNIAKNLCPTDYPDTGKVALTIGWKESKHSLPYLIVQLLGTKADFCVGYERAQDKSSDILAGYVMMNNFFSFPVKQVARKQDLQLICQSDYIQKFCREFQ